MSGSLPALMVVALLGGWVCACGGTASTASSALPAKYRGGRDADGDNDNRSRSRYDSDDGTVLYLGHAATGADARAITALVERYYAAAAAADGATTCRLLYSLVAETVVEEYGAALRANTCTGVMSKLFQRHHGELVAKLAALHVVMMRVEGSQGDAVVGFGAAAREALLLLHRERDGVWKLNVLLDSVLP